MPYTPPDYDEVDFDFVSSGYSPPVHPGINFAFDPVKHLLSGRYWKTSGGTHKTLVRVERFATLGIDSQTRKHGEHWRTSGVASALLERGERWITQGAAAEILRNERWATVVPAVSVTTRDFRFAVTGVRQQELPAWRRWATDGAPLHISLRGERWATLAPVVRAIDAWRNWITRAPAQATLVAGRRWASFAPEFSILTREERWFFNLMIAAELEVVYGASIAQELEVTYPLGADTVAAEVEITSPLLSIVAAELEVPSPINDFDVVAAELEVRYSILDGSVIYAPSPPTITVRGQTFVVDDVEVEIEEGEFAWTCQVVLPDPDKQFGLFGVDEPFTVTIGGETFSFIRQEPRTSRSGPAQRGATIAGISPSAIYATPRGERFTKTWSSPTLVSAILEELFGADVVELRILDWSVPADRLAVTAQTPIEIAQALAKASGAVLESEPDGSLYIRALWPVPVRFLETETADHVYDDTRDVFKIDSRVSPQRIENRIRIIDTTDASDGLLQVEVDAREDGLNNGRTNFGPGDRPAVQIFKSQNVELGSVRSSAGSIAPEASGTMEVEEQITFADSAEATLRYPTVAIDAYEWLGNDLGTPELSDETTVRLAAPGVGVLHVTYTTAFEAKRISSVPATLAGETEFDVLVVVEGTQT